MLKFQLNIY